MMVNEKEITWKSDFFDELFVVINVEECLKSEFCSDKYQICLLRGGNGCYADHLGRGVFVEWLDGDSIKITRDEVLGVPSKVALKDWYAKYNSEIISQSFRSNIENVLKGVK